MSRLARRRIVTGCDGFGHERVRVEVEGGDAGAMMALWRGGNDD